MSTWGLDLSQAEHDARHPGKICQTCPIERRQREAFAEMRASWERREGWRMRWLPWIAGAILVGCWLLGSWLTR